MSGFPDTPVHPRHDLSSVWQPGQPVFWVMAAALTVCIPVQLGALAAEDAPAALAAAGLSVGIAQLAILLIAAALLFRVRRSPRPLQATALVWGLFVVPVVAAFANARHSSVLNAAGLHSFAASIAAPIDEDTLGVIGTLGVLALTAGTPVALIDGARYGFLVGAGFEVAENLAYMFGADDLAGGMQVALVRSGVGFGLHAMWAGIAGAALAAALGCGRASRPARWGVLAAGIGIPMLLHACWDAPNLSADPNVVFAMLVTVYVATASLFAGCVIRVRRRVGGRRRRGRRIRSPRSGRTPECHDARTPARRDR